MMGAGSEFLSDIDEDPADKAALDDADAEDEEMDAENEEIEEKHYQNDNHVGAANLLMAQQKDFSQSIQKN